MKKDKIISVISGPNNNYYIHENVNGYYVVVKTKSKLKLLKERISDFFGTTSIHPKWLDNWYHSSIKSAEWKIDIQIKQGDLKYK